MNLSLKNIPDSIKKKVIHNIRLSSEQNYQYLWHNFAKFIHKKFGYNKFPKVMVYKFFLTF